MKLFRKSGKGACAVCWDAGCVDCPSVDEYCPVNTKEVRWCETHDCQHMYKDACTRRMVAFGRREDGAVNLGEQMDGPKECVEGWRTMVTPE